ncbi:MAG: hypothetical protein HQ507_01550 [Candidatus Marinimicrobia bacterium]|nr:hypothetical protein [Candidatus Neomarinimicrobiota bacterium]
MELLDWEKRFRDGVDDAGNRFESGLYFFTLRAGVYLETIKMVYLR